MSREYLRRIVRGLGASRQCAALTWRAHTRLGLYSAPFPSGSERSALSNLVHSFSALAPERRGVAFARFGLWSAMWDMMRMDGRSDDNDRLCRDSWRLSWLNHTRLRKTILRFGDGRAAREGAAPQVARRAGSATVALVDWSQLLEDFLDNIGSRSRLLRRDDGGWMFGYIDALRLAGVAHVLFCVSARVPSPTRFRTVRPGEPSACCRLHAHIVRSDGGCSILMRRRWRSGRGCRRLGARVVHALKESPLTSRRRSCTCGANSRASVATSFCVRTTSMAASTCPRRGLSLRLPVFATFQGGAQPLSVSNSWCGA